MLNEVNYTFAVQKGTFESDVTLKKFPYASYKEYTTFDETLEAVHLGEADATVIASSLHKKIEKKYPDLKVTYIVHSLIIKIKKFLKICIIVGFIMVMKKCPKYQRLKIQRKQSFLPLKKIIPQ